MSDIDNAVELYAVQWLTTKGDFASVTIEPKQARRLTKGDAHLLAFSMLQQIPDPVQRELALKSYTITRVR